MLKCPPVSKQKLNLQDGCNPLAEIILFHKCEWLHHRDGIRDAAEG